MKIVDSINTGRCEQNRMSRVRTAYLKMELDEVARMRRR